MKQAVAKFGGIDILVNNASAISLTGTARDADEALRPDAPHEHARHVRLLAGVHSVTSRRPTNPHILNLSPPLNMEARWFAPHVAYTMAKFGMSMCVLGMAEELKPQHIAVNALWPRTVIATAAVQNLLGGDDDHQGEPHARRSWPTRRTRSSPARAETAKNTGNFFIDDEVLASEGVKDLSKYAMVPGAELIPDFFV